MNQSYLIHFYGSDDLERTHHFYHDILGFELYKDQGACRIYKVNQSYIGFCSHLQLVFKHKSPLITLVCDDVDVIYQKLVKMDSSISPPIVNEQFKIYHFFSKDPNGYTIEVQKFLKE